MTVTEAIYKRRAIKAFDPDFEIPPADLKDLIETTRQAPSSFNLQHVQFILITDRAIREKLLPSAMNQSHFVQASVAVLMVGDPDIFEHNPEYVWRDAPKEVADLMVSYIQPFHNGRPQLQRDEVIRSVGISAMTLMLAAVEKGYETCPMIGFDHETFAQELGVPPNYAIGGIVLIGKGTKAPWPKPGLRDDDKVVFLNSFGNPANL